ncbi:MAG: PP2C family protein-serine/threonine phosphatase [Pseudomonadota bacterium]
MKVLASLSIRTKLMLSLLGLTGVMLSLYAVLALNDFKNDKLAYVYNSNLEQAQTTAKLFKSEVSTAIEKINFFMRGFDYLNYRFHPYSASTLGSDKRVRWIQAFRFDKEDAKFVLSQTIGAQPDQASHLAEQQTQILIQEALESELALGAKQNDSTIQGWNVALRYSVPDSEEEIIVIAELTEAVFIEALAKRSIQDSYLLNYRSRVVFGPIEAQHKMAEADFQSGFEVTQAKLGSAFGIKQYRSTDGQTWLFSVVDTGYGNFKVVSTLPTSVALEAVHLLAIKSVAFFLILLCITFVMSLLGAHRLTTPIKKLLHAAKLVSSGNFDVQVDHNSQDEIGGLAEGFNHMTSEIKRLVDETAEKARMQAELETAKTVQSSLFPENFYEDDEVQIRGFYEPASECGGDWWHYNQIGSKTYMWIGDATGHGVPAALITSAAKSAATVLEQFPEMKVSQLLRFLNKAVHETAKGEVNMTFFVCCFDRETQELSYSSASHDPPFLITKTDKELKRKDVQVLMSDSGLRLGQAPDSLYSEEKLTLQPECKIVFYTDGITELEGPDGKHWGERKFINKFLSAFNSTDDLSSAMEKVAEGVTQHRDGSAAADDITYFMFRYKGKAAKSENLSA